ncbi:unnamed protein product, partial [Rotaria sp. Silwood2]
YDDVSSSDDTNYHVEMNALDDEFVFLVELKQNSLIGVHVRDEPYEMIGDNDIGDISLPGIMK